MTAPQILQKEIDRISTEHGVEVWQASYYAFITRYDAKPSHHRITQGCYDESSGLIYINSDFPESAQLFSLLHEEQHCRCSLEGCGCFISKKLEEFHADEYAIRTCLLNHWDDALWYGVQRISASAVLHQDKDYRAGCVCTMQSGWWQDAMSRLECRKIA